MSDLFCAATVLFARHGDAEFVERTFSDEGGSLTAAGRKQAATLGDALRGRRVARVWCSDSSRAVQTAEIAAARLGVDVVARKALREVDVGELDGTPFDRDRLREVTALWAAGDLTAAFPGGESAAQVAGRLAAELGEIADLHRGETVLVVGHETMGCAGISALAGNLSPPYGERLCRLDHGETVEFLVDADGVRVDRWGDLTTG